MNDSSDQQDRCGICGKNVADVWFARIRRGQEWIKLCSPACAMRYIEGPPSAGNDGERESEAGVDRVHFVFSGES